MPEHSLVGNRAMPFLYLSGRKNYCAFSSPLLFLVAFAARKWAFSPVPFSGGPQIPAAELRLN